MIHRKWQLDKTKMLGEGCFFRKQLEKRGERDIGELGEVMRKRLRANALGNTFAYVRRWMYDFENSLEPSA